jgi:riboflavin-specific deaminase-like protein
MVTPIGPGSPFELLFAEEQHEPESLAGGFRQLYPGDWHLPRLPNRPYIYSNFAISRDGRISFNLPGQRSARYVTKAVPHDRWLMGVLRMKADAVLIGDGTIQAEPDYLSTPASIYPDDAAAYCAQRQADGRAAIPLTVILSAEGRIPEDAECLHNDKQHLIVATTCKGAERVKALPHSNQLEVLELGETLVDLQQLVGILYKKYAVQTMLCEGGATVFGNLLQADLVDDEFVTWCPTFVGRSPDCFRPSYCEGVAWTPQSAPYSKPISMHKAGNYFYLHTRTMRQPAFEL